MTRVPTLIPALQGKINLRAAQARLERHGWKNVKLGLDGLGHFDHKARKLHIIHSIFLEADGEYWEHISLSRTSDGTFPTWEQTRDVFHEVAGPDALGIIVIPPKEEHVNEAEVAHAWRCLTARPIPDFRKFGLI
jgi:hypothetical protein